MPAIDNVHGYYKENCPTSACSVSKKDLNLLHHSSLGRSLRKAPSLLLFPISGMRQAGAAKEEELTRVILPVFPLSFFDIRLKQL